MGLTCRPTDSVTRDSEIQLMLEQYGHELHVQFKQDADFSPVNEVLDHYTICGWLNLQIWNHGREGPTVKLYRDF